MRQKAIYIALFFGLIVLNHCTSPIVFVEPQPEVVPERYRFHAHYQGTYFCPQDSALVQIEERGVYKERKIHFETTIEEIAETEGLRLEGEQLYIQELDGWFPVEFAEQGAVTGKLHFSDTLFWVGPGQVLKYYNGHQFMNKQIGPREWEVFVLSMQKNGDLTLLRTKLPEDLQELEEITPIVEDLSTESHEGYLIAPNLAAFRKLLRTKLIFEECDYYERVRPNTTI